MNVAHTTQDLHGQQWSSNSRPSFTGRRAAVVLFSSFPDDPRPTRAALALRAQGMDVDMLCIDDGGNQQEGLIDGVQVYRLSRRRGRGQKLSYILQYGGFLWKCLRFLCCLRRGVRYDLIHVHNMPDFLVFAALLPRLTGARVILDLHDPMPELMEDIYGLKPGDIFLGFIKFIEGLSIAFSHAAITPNIRFRELFLSRGCPPWKMGIIMNSPDDAVFTPSVKMSGQKSGAGRFRIMHHGSILRRHGLDLLVQAIALVRQRVPGVELDIYGASTGFLDTVMAEAGRLGLGDCVRYCGFLNQEGIASVIPGYDLGVIPNRPSPFIDSNFPTRLFEYLALGCPVIAPDTRGIRDYFDVSEMVYFNPGDVRELADRILWVQAHPQEAAECVAKGRRVYARHLWTTERAHFLGLAEELLDRGERLPVV